ncbi:MAG: hypothetical protein WBG95_04040 [Sulfitobacter sp.]
MTTFTIANFNLDNLIGAGKEYHKFQPYMPGEYARTRDWLADQGATLKADILRLQEATCERRNTYGSHPEAPFNELASDHGLVMANIKLGKDA